MFKAIWSFVKNSFVSILQGKLLLRLKVDKYFPQIVYVFFLLCVAIWASLKTDYSMNKVEDNKKIIEDLDIVYTMKKYEIESRNDRRTISKTLKELGSELQESDKPAYRIKEKD